MQCANRTRRVRSARTVCVRHVTLLLRTDGAKWRNLLYANTLECLMKGLL